MLSHQSPQPAANSARLSAHAMARQQGVSVVPLILGLVALILFFAYMKSLNNDAETGTADVLADPNGLYILAGSELKDIEPFLPEIQDATGIQVQLDYTGTLDGVDSIVSGKAVDAAWFSHGKYLSLVDHSKVVTEQKTMLSPVILGMKQSKAQSLGWITDTTNQDVITEVTWADIAKAAGTGQLSFAMTNPASSNSGFTALMGVTAALAGTSDATTAEDIKIASPQLKSFFQGQKLTSGSSGWLADAYTKQEAQLDGLINYESVLMQLNNSGQLQQDLVLVYPKEGIVTADYPLMLINNDKKEQFDKLVAYLTSTEFQTKLMAQTNRRPVNTQVALAPEFYNGLMIELPFPNNNAVVDDILLSYLNKLRIPAHAAFVLDTSGSMRGDGITQLKQAMTGLAGDDNSNTGRFAKFSEREIVEIIPFSQAPQPASRYTFTADTLSATQQQLKDNIAALEPNGGTAIYTSLESAYQVLLDSIAQDNGNAESRHYYSIVLMSDGDNSDGMSFKEFAQRYQSMPPAAKDIKVFPVLFGDANQAEMQAVADLTGGRVFDGRSGDLAKVFKKIRGYQ